MGNVVTDSVVRDAAYHIILVGDSVFDDFSWDDRRKNPLRDNIIRAFMGKVALINLSHQECQLADVFEGIHPLKSYLEERRKYRQPDYPLDSHGVMFPLKALSSVRKDARLKTAFKESIVHPTVVISVGLFDIGDKMELGKPVLIQEGLKQDLFMERYEQLVQSVVDLSFNVIMVLPYEPHESLNEGMLHFAREDLLAVYDWAWMRLLKIAERHGVSVIDLSRTFDCYDRTHYGSSPLIPSKKSSKFIAELIHHVFKTPELRGFQDARAKVKGGSDPDALRGLSRVYYGIPEGKDSEGSGIKSVPNNQETRESYASTWQKQAPAFAEPTDMDLLADLFSDQFTFSSDKPEEEPAGGGFTQRLPRSRSNHVSDLVPSFSDNPSDGCAAQVAALDDGLFFTFSGRDRSAADTEAPVKKPDP